MANLKPGIAWNKLQKKTKVTKVTKKKTASINKVSKIDTKDAAKMKKWAEENDIPLEDVSKTYNLPTEPIPPKPQEILSHSQKELGRYLAIDCEFVGVGKDGLESVLARVSIVNFHGHTVYDRFVQPRERVTDWRTWVSGVTPQHMKDAIDFKTAQKEVSDLLQDRVLVGHAVDHDLDSLFLSHPKSMIRDTSRFPVFRNLSKGKTPGLKKLAKEILKLDIQGAEHSSVEDAKATMMLYKSHKREFEKWATAKAHIRR